MPRVLTIGGIKRAPARSIDGELVIRESGAEWPRATTDGTTQRHESVADVASALASCPSGGGGPPGKSSPAGQPCEAAGPLEDDGAGGPLSGDGDGVGSPPSGVDGPPGDRLGRVDGPPGDPLGDDEASCPAWDGAGPTDGHCHRAEPGRAGLAELSGWGTISYEKCSSKKSRLVGAAEGDETSAKGKGDSSKTTWREMMTRLVTRSRHI